jgi:hypothetical protein
VRGLKPYYDSIDNCPCWNFDKVISTGDYSFLFIAESDNKIKPSELEKIWENIYDEFIKEFGISDEYKQYLENMGLYVQCIDAAYNGGDKSQLTMAEVNRRRAEEFLKGNDKNISVYAVVSKFMRFPCKPKELTVKEFYGYLKLASNGKKD